VLFQRGAHYVYRGLAFSRVSPRLCLGHKPAKSSTDRCRGGVEARVSGHLSVLLPTDVRTNHVRPLFFFTSFLFTSLSRRTIGRASQDARPWHRLVCVLDIALGLARGRDILGTRLFENDLRLFGPV
jgi:hypothetical protein